jgi:hypothetical protein
MFTDISEVFAFSIILIMEAVSTSETPVNFSHTTQCNSPEDSHLQTIIVSISNAMHTSN